MAQPLDESDGVSGQGIHGLDLGGGRRHRRHRRHRRRRRRRRRRHLRLRRQRTLQQLRGEGEVMRGKGEL